ncbi:MAG: CoA transferase [Roseovarius sp.]|nr:CoA transferase [Roseovarius sp.]
MAGPLENLRILDMTTVMMGPYATQILGDWGADVIKLEPDTGDINRIIGPKRNEGMGPVGLHLNRNKRSIALNTKSAAGKDTFLRFVETVDVFVTNVRPESLGRMGFSYEALAKINPKVIFISITGFGQNGPYGGRPAYDDLIQGAVGIPWLSQRASGEKPRYAPIALADRAVGIYAVGVVLAAVHARQRTGRGQHVEVPMFETMTQFVMGDHMQGETFVPAQGPSTYPRLADPDRRPYETKDGHICAMIYSDANWRDFLISIGKWDELKDDPRIADLATRTRHTSELYSLVAEAMKTRTTEAWMKLFFEHDIPATPMHSPDTLMQDPHLREVGFFTEVDHPTEGRLISMSVPNVWSDTQPDPPRPAPRIGEHTVEVLLEAGFSRAEIQELLRNGEAKSATKIP